MQKGLKRDVMNAALVATTAVVAVKTFETPEKLQMADEIAEQQEVIRQLSDELVCLEDDRVSASTPSDTARDKNESPIPVSDPETLRHEFQYYTSLVCQFSWDPVSLAIDERNSCGDSKVLNGYMGKMYRVCNRALKFQLTDAERDSLLRAQQKLEDYRMNYRISPPQCGDPPVFETN